MRRIKLNIAAIILLLIAVSVSPIKSSAQVSVSFQVFYDNLAPYGNWVAYPGYGYVWVPGMAVGFRPYVTGGHWVYSDEGWVWASDYAWGWAPFHYGSWIDDPNYGWVWVPGYDWAPAWVTWGTYNGYYGWAPVGPGFSISVGYYPPINHWCFIEPRYIVAADWGNHYYVAHDNRIAIGGGVVITNERRISSISNTANYGGRAYYAGPKRQDVERVAHTTIAPVSLRESNKPGRIQASGNTVSIYRPKINAGTKVYSRPSNAAPIERTNSRQNASNSSSTRMPENRTSAPDRNHNSGQQLQPTYQPPQKTRKESGEVMHSSVHNSPSAQQQPRSPQAMPQQHSMKPQQAAPHQHIERRQSMGKQPAAPQQREQAPKQEQQKQEGRPKGYRY